MPAQPGSKQHYALAVEALCLWIIGIKPDFDPIKIIGDREPAEFEKLIIEGFKNAKAFYASIERHQHVAKILYEEVKRVMDTPETADQIDTTVLLPKPTRNPNKN